VRKKKEEMKNKRLINTVRMKEKNENNKRKWMKKNENKEKVIHKVRTKPYRNEIKLVKE
jgi:hypothetical protein